MSALRRAPLALLAAALCCPVAVPGGEAPPPAPPPQGIEALISPAEARGLYDDAAREWLAAAAAAPDGPGAELALRRLAASRDLLASLAPLAEELEKLAGRDDSSPAVRFLARRLLVDRLREAGKWKEAARLAGELGYVERFLAVGSFGRDIPAVHDRVFDPETNPDLTAACDPGRACAPGRLSWRQLPEGPAGQPVDPFAYLRPAGGAAYLLAQLRTEKTEDAVLIVTCRAGFKLWLNGEAAGDADRGRRFLPSEMAFPVRLAKGWNRLLIKVSARAELTVRLTGEGGVPLVLPCEPGLVLHPVIPAPAPAKVPAPDGEPGKGADTAGPVPSVVAGEQPAAERRGAPPPAIRGFLLHLQGLGDEAIPLLREAADADPGRAGLRFALGEACAAAEHLSAPARNNLATQAYRECLKIDPAFVPALLRLAEQEVSEGAEDRALELLDEACRAGSTSHLPWLRRAEVAAELGWRSQARAWLTEAQKLRPDYAGCRLLEARLQREAGVLDRSVAELRELVAADASSRTARSLLAGAMADRGLWRDAIKLCRETVSIWPADPAARLELAGVLEASGSFSDAASELEAAASLVPRDAAMRTRLGDVLAKAGDRKRSLEAYAVSLELDPGQHRLRRLVERLNGVDEDFSAPYALDMMKELAESEKLQYPGSDAVRVLDQTVLRVYPDGSVAEIVTSGEKVLAASAVDRVGRQPLPGELMEARTIRKDGTLLEPAPIPGEWLTMPGLEPGAAVECRYRIEGPSQPFSGFHLRGWYFRSPHLDEPFQVSDYVVMIPAGVRHRVVRHNLNVVQERVEEKDGMTVYRWTARNQPQVPVERNMPHFDHLLPFVEIGTQRSWQDVADTFRSAYLFRTRPTRLVTESAGQACAGRTGPLERARGIYEFVNSTVRSRGPLFTAHQVLSAGAGDREAVFLALADAAGLEVCQGRTRPAPEREGSRQPPATWELPSEQIFTAELVGVRLDGGRMLWLDLSSRFMPFGDVRPELGGARVLAVPMKGPAFFERLPEPGLDRAGVWTDADLRLAGSGRMTGSVVLRCQGAEAAARRERMESMGESGRREAVGDELDDLLPGAALLDLSFETAPDTGAYVTKASVEADGALVPAPRGLVALRAIPTPLGLLTALAGDASRLHPLKLAEPLAVRQTISCRLDRDLELAELPEVTTVAGPFGSCSLSWSRIPGGFRLERRVVVPVQTVAPSDYQAFRIFCRDVDEAERVMVMLRPASPVAPGPGAER